MHQEEGAKKEYRKKKIETLRTGEKYLLVVLVLLGVGVAVFGTIMSVKTIMKGGSEGHRR